LSAGSNLRIALDLYLASLRRQLRPMVVMVAMMVRRKHRGKYKEEELLKSIEILMSFNFVARG
jgi:hypothetical protein